jgi:hypothetical protein
MAHTWHRKNKLDLDQLDDMHMPLIMQLVPLVAVKQMD